MTGTFNNLSEAFLEQGASLSEVIENLKTISALFVNAENSENQEETKNKDEKLENDRKREAKLPDLSVDQKQSIANALKRLQSNTKQRNLKITKLMRSYDKHFELAQQRLITDKIEQTKKRHLKIVEKEAFKTQLKLNYLLLKLVYLTSSSNVANQPVPRYQLNERSVNICNVDNPDAPVWKFISRFENLDSTAEFNDVVAEADKITESMCNINFVARIEKIEASKEVDGVLAEQLSEIQHSLEKIKQGNSESEKMLFSKSGNSIRSLLSQFQAINSEKN
ncbi:hypothetical protein ACO0QE_001688 [Hanseniaspora vineae]